MNLSKINRLLKEQIDVMESEGGPALPRMFVDNQEKAIKGLFNDVADETGYKSWGFRVTGNDQGASGHVNFGWSTETGPARVKTRGVRLVAHATPDVIAVHILSAAARKDASTPHDQMGRVPTVTFASDGSDYVEKLRALVDRVRKAVKR
jgi:hypothetical protein